jgi:hypothetical protein
MSGCSGCNYSDGERIGVLTKFASKGLIWKTYEGEMNLGGLREQSSKSGTSYVANLWEFSIDSQNPDKEKLAEQLFDALDKGSTIKVKYEDRGTVLGCWRSSTSYWITEITIIN